MTVDTSFIDRLKQVFYSDVRDNRTPVRKNRTTEIDERINEIAPERIKRSPGHNNISQLNDEPDWYHD